MIDLGGATICWWSLTAGMAGRAPHSVGQVLQGPLFLLRLSTLPASWACPPASPYLLNTLSPLGGWGLALWSSQLFPHHTQGRGGCKCKGNTGASRPGWGTSSDLGVSELPVTCSFDSVPGWVSLGELLHLSGLRFLHL